MAGNDPLREQIYHELRLRETLDLVALWQAHDRSQWSDAAFDVMQQLLKERLGRLPAREPEPVKAEGADPGEIDENADPEIKQLWVDGDTQSLAEIVEHDADWMMRLDAAEALADLGDERGDEYLAGAMQDPAPDVRALAGEIRAWLDDPGTERQTTGMDETEAAMADEDQGPWPAADAPNVDAAPSQPASQAYPRTTPPSGASGPSGTSGMQPADRFSTGRAGQLRLAGGAGGLLGLLAFYLGLYALGAVPAGAAGGSSWIWDSVIVYLPISLAVGMLIGPVGGRLASNTTDAIGIDETEDDWGAIVASITFGGAASLIAAVLIFLATRT
jgi:hypothetical protein